MKRCALALLLLGACTPAARMQPTTLRLPADDDVISVQIAIRAGSADDPPGKAGLTHLLLHLMREGGAGELDAFAVRERLFETAAELDVTVDREVSVISLRVHRDLLAETLPLLEAMIASPRFEVRTFDRLRRDALDGIRNALRGTEEEWLAEEALSALVYANHPFGHPIIGTEEGLASLSLADVHAHRARLLCRGRVTVGVTGNAPLGLEDALAGLFSSGELCRGPAALPSPTRGGPRVLLVSHPAARAATVRMLAPYEVTRAHPDHPALVLFASYLGLSGQFIGRLMQSIRESRGLNYGDYAYAEHIEPNPFSRGPAAHAVRSQQGFEIMLRPMTPAHVPFVTRLVFRELERALAVLPPRDLERVAGFLDGFLPLWLETPDARLGSALDQAYFGLDEPYVTMLRRALRALDAEDVREAAVRHVDPRALRVVIVTPDALATREALLRGTLAPITYDHPVSADVLAEDREILGYDLGLTERDVAIVDVSALFVR